MHLASVSNQIQCYDWPSGSIVKTYNPRPASSSRYRSASWASNAGWMCLVTAEGYVNVVSFKDQTGKFLHQIEDISNANYATFQNLNKREIAIATNDTIMIYDMKKSAVKKHFGQLPENACFFKVAFDSHDIHMCAGATNNIIYVYDTNGLNKGYSASNTGNITNFVVNNTNGLKIAACTDSGACILWEVEGITNIYSEPTKCSIQDLIYRDNSLLYVNDNRQCVLRDMHNTSVISKINLHYQPKCVDMSVDNVSFAICSRDGIIYGYDIRNLVQPINKIKQQEGGEKTVQISFCKHQCNQNVQHDATVMSRCCKTCKVSRAIDDSELHIVHEYKSLIETDTDASGTSLQHCAALHFDNFPRLCDISEDTELMDAHTISLIRNSNIDPGTTESLATQYNCQILNEQILDMVKSSVKDEMEVVKKDLKRHIQKIIQDITKTNFYDLRMALVKEFIKIQDILDKLHASNKTIVKNDGDNNSCA